LLIENKNREIERLSKVYAGLLANSGIDVIEGTARLIDPHAVAIGERTVTAKFVLVATGGRPRKPAVPGIEHAITSNEAFELAELPRRVLIVGGGYIAVEFAGIFHALGVEVTQLYRGRLFLRGFDDDVRETLADEMRKKGIDLRFQTTVEKIEKGRQGLRAKLIDGTVLAVDQIMFATGRHPNTAGLGLESLGVRLTGKGAVEVDEYSRTSVPNIYAIGDCTDRLMLTPVAIAEGRAVAETLFNDNPMRPNYANVPTAVFSLPNVGTVGLTEREARERNGKIDVYRTRFRPLKHTLSGRDEMTMMKLVVDRATDRVLGCHMVGQEAGEIVQGIAVALTCGATKAHFDATIGIHPTAAEELVTMRTKVPEPDASNARRPETS